MRARLLISLLAPLATLACAGSAPPSDTHYRLRVTPPAARAAPLLPGVVEVERLGASGVLLGRPLAVAQADRPDVLHHARYHFWVDAPPVLLQQALLAYLREGGLASRAVAPERRDEPDWLVSGRVERFERIAGEASAAVVAVELSLRRRSERRLLVQGLYQASRPAGDSARASVEAMDAAVQEVFAAFIGDVETALSP